MIKQSGKIYHSMTNMSIKNNDIYWVLKEYKLITKEMWLDDFFHHVNCHCCTLQSSKDANRVLYP